MTAYSGNKEFIVIRWNDNRIVSVVSNMAINMEYNHFTRWSRKDGEWARVDLPFHFHRYNQTMSAVDRLDQNVDKDPLALW